MAAEIVETEFLHVGRQTLYNDEITIVATAEAQVYIGSFCAVGKNLKIITLNHDWDYPALQGTFYRHHFNTPHPGEVGTPTRERTKAT
ncbi:acetyltransferase-like isoleucine patch superfamily enzyme [Rhizobium sp. BK313]|uniref:hypothetical protein n=1 Tax=Rhizobium sp. BK313 TaxID=2587081 RepID=UPI00105B5938|nr:hypothetical protein [Rhizobium sp. BK313]MBB3457268.1 acetyltransferase-like isoleucine patch superfamily enzyme [Rhizobium sp. BK313]